MNAKSKVKIDPASGPIEGGTATTITVDGSKVWEDLGQFNALDDKEKPKFLNDRLMLMYITVMFGTKSATEVQGRKWGSDGTLTIAATTPSSHGKSEMVDVVVFTPGGFELGKGNFTYKSVI